MSTNPDPFENDLRALQRRTLPEGWRGEILQAAAASANTPPAPAPHAARTPRWLLAGWGVAWAAILALYFTTPSEPSTSPAVSLGETAAPLLWQQRAATLEALLAAN